MNPKKLTASTFQKIREAARTHRGNIHSNNEWAVKREGVHTKLRILFRRTFAQY